MEKNDTQLFTAIVPEFYHEEKNVWWYVAAGSIFGILLGAGFFLQNWFFMGFLTLAGMIFLLLEIQGPQMMVVSIFDDRIQCGERAIPFSEIASFGVYQWGATNFIILIPQKPTLQAKTLAKLVFVDTNAFERAKTILAEKLTEEPFEPTLIEYIGHFLKLS